MTTASPTAIKPKLSRNPKRLLPKGSAEASDRRKRQSTPVTKPGHDKPHYSRPSIDEAIKGIQQIKSIHAACKSIPPIGKEDFDRLVDHIGEHGLLHRVQINAEGQLLDGRSRLMALHVLGTDITDKMIDVTNVDPITIARANLARRNLDEGTIVSTVDQLAMLAVEYLEAEREQANIRKTEGARRGGKAKATRSADTGKLTGAAPVSQKRAPTTNERVAEETGIPQRKLKAAETLQQQKPALADQVKSGKKSLSDALSEAGIEKPKAKPRKSTSSGKLKPPSAQTS